MATHTWKIYLTLGRTWGGPRLSGVSIVAYTTSGGNTVAASLTTNSQGYAEYTTSSSPMNFFWRVHLGNTFGDYYPGNYIVGTGDTTGYWSSTPTAAFNTKGTAIVASNYNSLQDLTYIKTIYFYVVGQDVSIDNDKALTVFDVESLLPPGYNMHSSTYNNTLNLNRCINGADIYDNLREYFYDYDVRSDSMVVTRRQIHPFTAFLSGTTGNLELSTNSVSFDYYASGDTYSVSVTGTCDAEFYPTVSISGTSKSYFNARPASISNDGSVYTWVIIIYPTNTNYTETNRIATVNVQLYPVNEGTWTNSTWDSAKITLNQNYYISSGTSGSTGGGTTGGGGLT